jgi:hypothetical protein
MKLEGAGDDSGRKTPCDSPCALNKATATATAPTDGIGFTSLLDVNPRQMLPPGRRSLGKGRA